MKEIYLDDERHDYSRRGGNMSSESERRYVEEMYRKMHGYPEGSFKGRSRRTMEEMPVSFIDMAQEYSGHDGSMRQFFDKVQYNFNHMDENEKEEFLEAMKTVHEGYHGCHFNEHYAKHEVAMMFHIEGNKKYVGEKFDMAKAREVMDMYRSVIPQEYTVSDVYVALNAQYHDYVVLFKSWFGGNSEHKIIESAINFWFRDDDCPENKVWDYFKD